MEKHCTTVYFLLKKTRKDKNGDSPIDAWIAVNGERTSYSTGKKVKVSEWDEKKQLVKGSSDKAKLINSYQAIRENQRRFSSGCFTGLAYIDIKTLRKEHFETDEEGRIWIKKKRVKTGVLSRIPLLPMAKLLLEKYKDWEGDMVMPIHTTNLQEEVDRYYNRI